MLRSNGMRVIREYTYNWPFDMTCKWRLVPDDCGLGVVVMDTKTAWREEWHDQWDSLATKDGPTYGVNRPGY